MAISSAARSKPGITANSARRGRGHGRRTVRRRWRKGEKYPVWMSHGDRVTAAAGFRAVGDLAERADRGDRDDARKQRRAIPSRGGAHAARRGALRFVRSRGLPRRLDHARIQARRRSRRSAKGRQGQGDLRPVRRRRLAVAAVLIHEAIGEQLTCVFVDHGLLRLGEAEKVVTLFRPLQHPARPRRGGSDSSARLPASAIPRQAQDDR